jgi:hypothetical protein
MDTNHDISKLQDRIRAHADFLRGDSCFAEQLHCEEGTRERAYWHYGYMVALRDVLGFLGVPPADALTGAGGTGGIPSPPNEAQA